jgi:hypothetical protein
LLSKTLKNGSITALIESNIKRESPLLRCLH